MMRAVICGTSVNRIQGRPRSPGG